MGVVSLSEANAEQGNSAATSSAAAGFRDIELLHELSVGLIGARDIDALYGKILDAAVAVMRSQFASMQMLYPERGPPGENGELRLLASRGFSAEAAQFWKWVRADSQSTCGMTLRTRNRSIAEDVECCEFMADSKDLATYRLTGIRSCQTTPLLARDGTLVGMISTHWSEPHQPSDRELRLFDLVARQAADLLERTKAEEALRSSERRLAGLLGSITDAFMSFDASFRFTFANDQCVRRMGKAGSELIGLNLWELFPPDAVGNIAHRELNWAMAERVAVEYEVFYPPWRRWFCDKAYPTADGGLAVYSQDITERKRGELLSGEQNRLLELVAVGASAQECLTALTDAISRSHPSVRAGVLLGTRERDAMGSVFAARLDSVFGEGIEGLPIDGTPRGSCSTAIFEGRPVECADVARDDRFSQKWRDHCLAHGVKACRSTPVFGIDGKAVASFVLLFDEPREADAWELRLAQFGAHVAGIVLMRERSSATLRASEERFSALINNIPHLAWMAEPGTQGQATWFNKAWLEYTGTTMEQNQGSGWQAVHHPDHAARVIAKFEHHVRESLDWEDTFPLRGKDGSFRWFLSRMNVIRDASGKAARIFGTNTDITELREAQDLQRILTGELSHRVKNMLATVQAIATQTLRHNKNPAAFVTSFGGRIQSMSRVHSQLSAGEWRGADLRDVIRDQIQLGPADETRVTAWGPSVRLDPQVMPQIAMMLHELGTNSIKYGALAKTNGVVTIGWTVDDGTLRLRWAERGGAPVIAPVRRGFGTALIEKSARGAGGEARMSIGADGVRWEITLPLPRVNGAKDGGAASSRAGFIDASQKQDKDAAELQALILPGKRFLVVEDEPLLALDVIDGLEGAGAEIAGSAGNVAEALDLIERGRFDAALLDANLGGRPVDDVAAALTRRHVPFAFVTGYGRDSLPRAFAGAAMISKPFSHQQLLDTAAALVKKPADVVALRG